MKILFVEDELSTNISRILRLFQKYLGDERADKLELLSKSERGAYPEDIRKLAEDTNLIEVEYRFPDALRKIVENSENYTLFVIDRNLSESDYEFHEVNDIDKNFSEKQYDLFFEREGDYLLQKLVYSGADVMTRFYFLTAYPAQDVIRSSREIETHINFGKFKSENLIMKGNDADFKRLQNIIENNTILNLQNENMRYLNILRTNITGKACEDIIGILKRKDDKNRGVIKDNLTKMRIIYEQILTVCSKIIPDMKANCTDGYGKIVLGHQTIEWLHDNKHIDNIISHFCYTISKIGSMGPHPNGNPTTDTVNALVYSLKDIIIWFGNICNKYR